VAATQPRPLPATDAARVPAGAPASVMIENLSTAVLMFDAGLRLRALNSAAEELLDLSAHKAQGLGADELLPGARAWTGLLRATLESGAPLTERELSIPLAGDRAIAVDCTVTPLDGAAAPRGVLVEMTRVDRHLRITREEQLLAQSQSLRTLLRGLAHEIRNPLGGLRGAAQLLEHELADPALREYTSVIIGEADRLQTLLDRMLGPRRPPELRAINVHEVTERVRALARAEAGTGVTVTRDYDPSIPELVADPDLLIQATLNVVRNAIQAVGEAGTVALRTRVHRQLTIHHRRHRLVVAIDVHDDGSGVPEELGELLFYPMVTGNAGGSGLGLCIAQYLVNQHGGCVQWTSAPGDTTFSILLPVQQGGAHGEPPPGDAPGDSP